MDVGEEGPRTAQIDTAPDQVSVRGTEKIGRYIGKPDA